MSIDSSRQNASSADNTDALSSLLPVTQTPSDTPVASDSFLTSHSFGKDSAHISKLGQLFSKLQSLATSDPARFTQVTENFAAKLKTEAAQIDGPQSQSLSRLADKFSRASQTGDLSALKPQSNAHGKVPAAYSVSSTDVLSAAFSGNLFQQLNQEISG